MKFRKKTNHKFIILIIIFILALEWISLLGRMINDNFIFYIKQNIKKEVNHCLFYSFSKEVAAKFRVDDLISLNLNKNGEVISVDYKMNEVYVMLGESLESLYNNLAQIDFSVNYKGSNKDVLWVPIGIGNKNILISNFGPKIPVKIEVLTDSAMGYKTQVKNYGINNVLLELYLDITINSSLLTPVSKEEIKDDFSILIASRIIHGTVPSYYNGVLESVSPLLNS